MADDEERSEGEQEEEVQDKDPRIYGADAPLDWGKHLRACMRPGCGLLKTFEQVRNHCASHSTVVISLPVLLLVLSRPSDKLTCFAAHSSPHSSTTRGAKTARRTGSLTKKQRLGGTRRTSKMLQHKTSTGATSCGASGCLQRAVSAWTNARALTLRPPARMITLVNPQKSWSARWLGLSAPPSVAALRNISACSIRIAARSLAHPNAPRSAARAARVVPGVYALSVNEELPDHMRCAARRRAPLRRVSAHVRARRG